MPDTSWDCKYSLDNGQWYAGNANMSGYMLSGVMKAISGTTSKFFQMTTYLTKTSEQLMPNGRTVQNITGDVRFGNGARDYNVETGSSLDITNHTLRLVGN